MVSFSSLSLKYRIAAVIFVLEAVMMITVFGLNYSRSMQVITEQVQLTEASIIALLSDLGRTAFITTEFDDLQPFIEQAAEAPHISKIMVIDSNDIVLVSSDVVDIGQNFSIMNITDKQNWKTRNITNSSNFQGSIAVKYSHQQLEQSTKEALNTGIIVAVIGMVIIAIVGLVTGILLTRRLNNVAQTAQKMTSGDLTARTSLHGSDEIANLGRAFDEMADSLSDRINALYDREQELDHIREDLEQRVSERTHELARAHDEAIAANQAKSTFLATMSHEIRTPLTAIIGFAEALLDKNSSIEERDQFANTILDSGNHLLNVINNILDLSKVEADKIELESLNVSPIEILNDITDLVRPLAETKKIVYNCNLNYPLPNSIKVDPVRLKQVLINLCNNAIKFTDKGSVIVDVSYKTNDQTLIIDIRDTGIGISPDQMKRIFDPFVQADSTTTRNYGGTGLGLSLSKRLIEIMGGKIEVDSILGKGSCFQLSLPCIMYNDSELLYDPQPSKSTSHTLLPTTNKLKFSGRVLVVEDTKALQMLIGRLLTSIGLEVQFVDNGEMAVEATSKSTFDVVFMDMQMPVMDGITAVKIIRSKGIRTPIIMLTANAMQKDRIDCLDAGADDFLSKPVLRKTLFEKLDKYFA